MKRGLLILALGAATTAAGYWAGSARPARAGHAIGAGDPVWTLNLQEFEAKAAQFFKDNAVTNDAQRATFVSGLTATQQSNALKAFFNCFHATTKQ